MFDDQAQVLDLPGLTLTSPQDHYQWDWEHAGDVSVGLGLTFYAFVLLYPFKFGHP